MDYDSMSDFDPIDISDAKEEPTEPTEILPASDWNPMDAVEAVAQYGAENVVARDSMSAADSRALANRYGLSRTEADDSLDLQRKRAERDDTQAILNNARVTANHLAENPADAPIFRADIKPLADSEALIASFNQEREDYATRDLDTDQIPLEQLEYYANAEGDVKRMSTIGRGLEAGKLMSEQGLMYSKLRESKYKPDYDFLQYSRWADQRTKELESQGNGAMYQAAQVVSTMFETTKAGADLKALGIGGAAGLVLGAPVMLGSMLAAGAYGTYLLEGGLSYKELFENDVDEDWAKNISRGVGITNAVIEMVGLKFLGKIASPYIRLLTRQFASKTAEALTAPTTAGALKGFVKAYIGGIGEETVTEVLQESVSMLGEELGRRHGGKNQQLTPEQVFDRLLDIATMTMKGTAVLGLLGAPVAMSHATKAKSDADSRQAKFENLAKTMQTVQANQTSPDAVAEVVQAQADANNVPTVYIRKYGLEEAMEEKGVTLAQLQAEAPEVAKAIESTTDPTEDIRIPMGFYASRIAPTPLGEALAKHARTSETQQSADEATLATDAAAKMYEESIKGEVQFASDMVTASLDAVDEVVDKAIEEELGVQLPAEMAETGTQEQEGTKELTPEQIVKEKERAAKLALRDTIEESLKKATDNRWNPVAYKVQAEYGSRVAQSLAKRLGMKPEDLSDYAASIVSVAEKPEPGIMEGYFKRTVTKADKEFLTSQKQWLKWLPSRTEDKSRIWGAPEWMGNEISKFQTLRNQLKKYVKEGAVGRYWYEKSGKWVYEFTNGNVKDAEKLIELIAIYSPQMPIGPNLVLAIRAFTHWKLGLPEESLKLKTSVQDEKARGTLYHDKPWKGRKTDTFYQNLMYVIVTEHEEECRAAGIDVDSILRGQSTIDMWMKRAFGYDSDATTDDKGTGQYAFCENTLRRITAEVNEGLGKDEDPWTPHQVQAAIWTAVKSRYDLVKDKTDKDFLKVGLAEMVPVLDKKTKKPKVKKNGEVQLHLERKSDAKSLRAEMKLWHKNSLAPKSETVEKYANENARSYATEFARMTQVVTAEYLPSPDYNGGEDILVASPAVKKLFTQEVNELFTKDNGQSILAELLGIQLSFTAESTGGYNGAVSPNMLTRLLPIWWGKEGEPSKEQVRKFCLIVQYITRQNAVPFFRIENRKNRIEANKFRIVGKDGKPSGKGYKTQAEAEEAAQKRNKKEGTTEYRVQGGKLTKAIEIVFDSDLTLSKEKDFIDKLAAKLGKKNGFTQTYPNKLLVANYRNPETGIPYDRTDEEFVSLIESLELDGVVRMQETYIDSEYGHDQDWHDGKWVDKDGKEHVGDPEGKRILKLLGVENESDTVVGGSGNPQGERAAGVARDWLVRRKADYEGLLRKYSGESLKQQERIANSLFRGYRQARFAGPSATGNLSGEVSDGTFRPEISGALPEFGERRGSAKAVVGIHFSRAQRKSIDTKFHGTGMRGAESARVAGDKVLDNRSYFYVDEGNGITPESDVGNQAHGVILNNLYNITQDPDGLFKKSLEESKLGRTLTTDYRLNDMEKALLAAGYDGWYQEGGQGKQGVACVLGDKTIPVQSIGEFGQAEEQQAEAPAKPVDTGAIKVDGEKVSSILFGEYYQNKYKDVLPKIKSYATVEKDRLFFKEKNRDKLHDVIREVPSHAGQRTYFQRFASALPKYVREALRQLAYHGSPFRFGRFTLDHIGEGEGMQTHGWGLYFSLDENTAKRYRNSFAHEKGDYFWTINGVEVTDQPGWSLDNFERTDKFIYQLLNSEMMDLDEAGEDFEVVGRSNDEVKAAAERIIDRIEEERDWYLENEEGPMSKDDFDWTISRLKEIAANPDSIKAIHNLKETNATIYKVDIPEDDVMLNESLPIDKQPKLVQEALRKIMKEHDIYVPASEVGGGIYAEISRVLGGDKAASLALSKEGVKGIRYNGQQDGECAVVFDDKSVKVLEYFSRNPHEVDRAKVAMELRGGYTPDLNRIWMTKNADLSTFAHETSHWYLENLLAMADSENASETAKADAAAILKSFGLKDVLDWRMLSFEERRKFHEQFAYLSEIYLEEGKAPIKSLEDFFRRFAAFIRDVYKAYKGGAREALGELFKAEFGEELPELSDEVRRVLDRMIASDEEMKRAEAAEGVSPMFHVKPEDMSEQDWAEMQQAWDESGNAAAEKYQQAIAKDERWYTKARSALLKEKQKEGKEVRAKIREKVEREVNSRPEVKAFDILASGGKDFGLDNLKLDPDALRASGLVNELQLAKLRAKGVCRVGGLPPSQTREMMQPFVRFTTDKQMIEALLAATDKEQIIEDETTKRCLEQHSDLFDAKKLDAIITKALHSEQRARAIATELKYLSIDKRLHSRVWIDAAHQAAMKLLATTTIKQATVRKFLASEAVMSRKAQQAFEKGNRELAFSYKRQQLVHHEAARIAIDAEKGMRALNDLKSRIFKSDKMLSHNYDVNLVAVVRAILTNWGFGRGDNVDGYKYIDKVEKYDPDTADVMRGVLDKYQPKPEEYGGTNLTVADFVTMMTDVKNLMNFARQSKEFKAEGIRKDLADVVTQLHNRALKVSPDKFRIGQHEAVSEKESRRKLVMTGKAMLRRVESWCLAMDGGETDGVFSRYIYQPVANAAARYRVRNIDLQKRLLDIVKPMAEKWDKQGSVDAPEIGYTFNRKAELIGAILHTGNRSNYEKLLLGGRGEDAMWAVLFVDQAGNEIFDDTKWQAFINRCYAEGIITKEDMDTVQAIWDLLESTKEDLQKAFFDYYGYYFEEVEASEVVTPFGTYRGGYVPAMMDADLVAGRGKQIEQDLFTNESTFLDAIPINRPGFTRSRTNVHKPLDLNIGMLGSHLSKVVRFAEMAQTVKSVNRVINNDLFRSTMNNIDPSIISEMLEPWLRRSALQAVSDPGGKFTKYANRMRTLASMSLMVGNVVNGLQQYTGLSIALTKVKASSLASALFACTMSPSENVEYVMNLSPMMKARIKDYAFEYQNQLESISSTKMPTKADAVRDWCQRHGYFIQTFIQKQVDIPVWIAAYNDFIAEGKSEADAVAHADSVVRTTQTTFDAEGVARVETGSALARMILPFYNYFNMQYNLLGERWAMRKQAGETGKFFLDYVLVVAVPAILAELIAQAFGGFDDDDDEYEAVDAVRLMTSAQIRNLVAMIPFVGNFINSAGAGVAKSGVDGVSDVAKFLFGSNPYNSKVLDVPVSTFSANVAAAPGSLLKFMYGEGTAKKAVRDMLDFLTAVSGIPFSAVKKPLGYTAAVVNNEAYPEDAVDVVRGLVSGKDVNK